MKLAVAAGLVLAMSLALMGCGVGEVSAAQQQSKQAALKKVADEDTTHVNIPGRNH